MNARLVALGTCSLLGLSALRPPGACAQSAPEWGTVAESAHTIPATSFSALNSGTVDGMLRSEFGTATSCTNGSCGFVGSVMLPTGARVVGLDLFGCASAANQITVIMHRCQLTNGGCAQLVDVPLSQPGCNASSGPLDITVQNGTHTYSLLAYVTATDPNLHRFNAVRVRYQLQVSPAPATATFADIPTTHPLYRFVEALAASGITGGCGGGNYCPDDPLTRGQMAVFLAVALGLHWPD